MKRFDKINMNNIVTMVWVSDTKLEWLEKSQVL